MRAALLAVLCIGCVRAATVTPTRLPVACRGGTVAWDETFPAADGLVVHATRTNPCGGDPRVPVVVLVHQMCSDRKEWSAKGHDWIAALQQRRYATLAVDLRGHGESQTWPDGSTHDLCEELGHADVAPLYAGMVLDVEAALQVAHKQSVAVGVVGASIGANSAIAAMAADPTVAAGIALSPGLDYRGITTEDAIAKLGKRPIFLVAADDDTRSAAAVRRLATVNRAATSDIFPTGEHGNRMIDAHPDALARLADWLAARMQGKL